MIEHTKVRTFTLYGLLGKPFPTFCFQQITKSRLPPRRRVRAPRARLGRRPRARGRSSAGTQISGADRFQAPRPHPVSASAVIPRLRTAEGPSLLSSWRDGFGHGHGTPATARELPPSFSGNPAARGCSSNGEGFRISEPPEQDTCQGRSTARAGGGGKAQAQAKQRAKGSLRRPLLRLISRLSNHGVLVLSYVGLYVLEHLFSAKASPRQQHYNFQGAEFVSHGCRALWNSVARLVSADRSLWRCHLTR